jgi:hypothetical protein
MSTGITDIRAQANERLFSSLATVTLNDSNEGALPPGTRTNHRATSNDAITDVPHARIAMR